MMFTEVAAPGSCSVFVADDDDDDEDEDEDGQRYRVHGSSGTVATTIELNRFGWEFLYTAVVRAYHAKVKQHNEPRVVHGWRIRRVTRLDQGTA